MGYYLKQRHHKSKYVGCAVEGCSSDCCVELTAKCENGEYVKIPGCLEHAAFVHSVKASIESNGTADRIEKIRIKEGKKILSVDSREIYVYTPEEKLQCKSPEKKVSESWQWVDDFDLWMNSEGKVVELSQLSDKELEDSTILIRRLNIKRRTKRIKWVAELEEIASPPVYLYPEEEFYVEQEDAYAKLDEFYEEFLNRELLP